VKTEDFAYELPAELIAQTPVEPRDASRLMVVDRATGATEHRIFRQVREYLRAGDLLVLNQTRVIPARLFGSKVETGGQVELLLLRQREDGTWEALVRGKGLRPGTRVWVATPSGSPQGGERARGVMAEIVGETEAGGRVVRFERPVEPLLEELGVVPLPPYIHVPLEDPERYQTVYGRVKGSVAASTAGLHFTPELLVDLRRQGVELAFVTLHIGLDTFRPVKEEVVEDHAMHSEWYELTAPVAEQINRARLESRRIVAVGTTVVRALESAARLPPSIPPEGGRAWSPASLPPRGEEETLAPCGGDEGGAACGWQTVAAGSGPTDLFIYPGYRFRVVEAMITNFHLPRSTLLMLVSAFAGRELVLRAYEEAIRHRYRFFSFGDAMLIL
jgi:S-adenosylmethionine:tRNA ribosyltransferase-isomerase